MSTNLKNNPNDTHHEEMAAVIARARAQAKARRILKAKELASRLKPQFDGTDLVVRFSLKERIQHFVLIFSFTALGFTGLMQTCSSWFPVAWVINTVLGGVDTLRVIHHLAAITFAIQTILHGFDILVHWFVKRDLGSMFPEWSDLTGLFGMLKYNLGFAKSRPEFDRFSIEEKLEYWALWWGAIVMGLTGLLQWFPAIATQLLPGIFIPAARLIHMLEAILAVLAIAVWHSYHTMIKERNYSVFTGVMTEHEMQEAHPLEYRRILAARNFLANVKNEPAPIIEPTSEAINEPINESISEPISEPVHKERPKQEQVTSIGMIQDDVVEA